MSSPLDDPQVKEWFRRFDAASQHLPANERASQREEIQQHLEGLAATNMASGQFPEDAWMAALQQFGDPTQIGRKIDREWQQGRTGFRADMKVILFGTCLLVLRYCAVQLLHFWGIQIYVPNDNSYAHGQSFFNLPFVIYLGTTYGSTVLINAAIGRKYPFQAIKGAFYAHVLVLIGFWISFIVIVSAQHANRIPQILSELFASEAFAHSMFLIPLWTLFSIGIAYLASVTKRGWYRPSLADFKLTLPRRRLKVSR